MDFVNLAREAWEQRDFDLARIYYQKAAYGIHGTDGANKAAFAHEVAQFAGEDPLYQQGIDLIRQYIAQKQGEPVLQSEMTAFVKKQWGEGQAEQLRYVLYYAEIRKEIFRKKQGRSYLLSLSEDGLTQITHSKAPKAKNTKHTKLFEPNQPYPADKISPVYSTDIAELNREATRHKDEKNWPAALSCLFKAKELTANEYQDVQQRLRLPLFLQQAGFFDAAKHELQYLWEHTDHFISLEASGRQNLRLQKAFLKNLYLERLFDKARLIYQREKQTDQAAQCQALSEQYQSKRLEANEALTQAQEQKRQTHREKYPKLSDETYTPSAIYSRDDIIRAQPTENPSQEPITSFQEIQNSSSEKQKDLINTIIGLVIVLAIVYWIFF